MNKEIKKCRICGATNLRPLFSLGDLVHAGVFNATGLAPSDPLDIIVCNDIHGCGLVQLKHEFDPDVMYGDHYGYRSGLNSMMVDHLSELASSAYDRVNNKQNNDITVLDIGSNDGTLLSHFRSLLPKTANLIGIDPSSSKFSEYYDPTIIRSDKFFSAKEYLSKSKGKKADIVTSIAMFYDLPNPQEIVQNISDILTEDGVWIVEQSYIFSMLSSNSFDTICHEHTEYYSLKQFEWMCERSSLEIIDMELNNSNGGSFRLYIRKATSNPSVNSSIVQFRLIENLLQTDLERLFEEFRSRILVEKDNLISHLSNLKKQGIDVCCLGASTKGNILLQHYQLDTKYLAAVAEVNPTKFGMKTPGTKIPIIDQDVALETFDHFLVLPWHFKSNFLQNPKFQCKKLIFPLSKFDVIEL